MGNQIFGTGLLVTVQMVTEICIAKILAVVLGLGEISLNHSLLNSCIQLARHPVSSLKHMHVLSILSTLKNIQNIF